jgi:hypothetical protein
MDAPLCRKRVEQEDFPTQVERSNRNSVATVEEAIAKTIAAQKRRPWRNHTRQSRKRLGQAPL